jgi:integrase
MDRQTGLVLAAERYVADRALVRRTYTAQDDKSWSANALNKDEIIERVANCDPFVGAQLRLCSAYGARVKEAIMCRPHVAEINGKLLLAQEWNCESYLEIKRGTKGGRMRIVPIDTGEKRAALDRAKRIALYETSSLGHPGLSLKQALNRFYNVLKHCGVTAAKLRITAHGLRHEYANDRYEQAAGQPSPIRGGEAIDRPLDRNARLSVAKELGHARENISTAYCGKKNVM